jgi:hypothetical protein
MELTLNCITWNKYLPEQYLWETNCGYHAFRNGSIMYNIINNINKKGYNKYISDIVNNKKFKRLLNKKTLRKDLLKYMKEFNGSSRINSLQLHNLIDKYENNKNIYAIYPLKDDIYMALNFKKFLKKFNTDFKSKKKVTYCFLVYRAVPPLFTHWVPIIFDKRDNNVYIHIIDSFNLVFSGDKSINKLINILFNKFNISNKCKNFRIPGKIITYSTKLITFIELVVVMCIISKILILFLKKNLI